MLALTGLEVYKCNVDKTKQNKSIQVSILFEKKKKGCSSADEKFDEESFEPEDSKS